MLTDEQIAALFAFCEKHLVRHYDLQVELVDHLANAIETKMALIKPFPSTRPCSRCMTVSV